MYKEYKISLNNFSNDYDDYMSKTFDISGKIFYISNKILPFSEPVQVTFNDSETFLINTLSPVIYDFDKFKLKIPRNFLFGYDRYISTKFLVCDTELVIGIYKEMPDFVALPVSEKEFDTILYTDYIMA